MSSIPRHLAAVAAGLFLATLPYWRYLPLTAAVAAHMDHEPRYGGQLGMVGDHHVELVRRQGRVEVFVSDATRRPVVPKSGRATFDREREATLTWENHRLVGKDRPAATVIDVSVTLAEGTTLAIGFSLADDS